MYVSLLQMAAPWLCLLGFVVICLFVLRQVLPIVCVFVLRQVLPAVQRTCHVDQTGFELTEIYLPLPLFFFFFTPHLFFLFYKTWFHVSIGYSGIHPVVQAGLRLQ